MDSTHSKTDKSNAEYANSKIMFQLKMFRQYRVLKIILIYINIYFTIAITMAINKIKSKGQVVSLKNIIDKIEDIIVTSHNNWDSMAASRATWTRDIKATASELKVEIVSVYY